MFLERTGLDVQLGTHVSREDWSGSTIRYTCYTAVRPDKSSLETCVHSYTSRPVLSRNMCTQLYVQTSPL